MDNLDRRAEAPIGQTYSIVLTDESPDLLDESYRIPLEITRDALTACHELKRKRLEAFSVLGLNTSTNSSVDLVAASIQVLSGLKKAGYLELIDQAVRGNTDAVNRLNGAGFYLSTDADKEFGELMKVMKAKGLKPKASPIAAKGVFDLSNDAPKLTVSKVDLNF